MGVRDGVEVEQLDVNDAASIRTAVASMLSQTGKKLDAVVHNAGVAAAGALEDVPESELRRVMETNFFGVLELTRALLPTFRAQRRGRIVIVSSEAAFVNALFPGRWPPTRSRRCQPNAIPCGLLAISMVIDDPQWRLPRS